MVTRKQHYYPRSLLKNFGDDNSTVFVYIRQANKIAKLSYENICFKRDAYESGGIIDNILENKLSTIEAKACGIIKNILQNWANENFKISQDDEEISRLESNTLHLKEQLDRKDEQIINLQKIIYNKDTKLLEISEKKFWWQFWK